LTAAQRMTSWVRDHHLWTHINDDHAHESVWPVLCRHPLCDDLIKDGHALWQHLVDDHGLSHSRPDAVSSRKRKSSDEPEFLEWALDSDLSSLKRSRPSTISPRMLSERIQAGYGVDETECLISPESNETLLDGCVTGAVGSPQLNTTDTSSADDSLFSEFLRSPSPSYMSIAEFSGDSSDTAVDPVSDEAIPAPTAQPPSGALDHDVIQAEGQSHAAVKPIRIRLRVNPPPSGTKIILRLKGPKLGKVARKGRKKA
jgi:hypothetical protein